MKKFLIVNIIILILSVCVMINTEESYADDKAWYKDYTYELTTDEDNQEDKYIIVSKYNKKAKEILVPSTAIIDGVTYKTKLLVTDNKSIWDRTKDILTSIEFEKGCIVEDAGFMFTDLTKLKTVNVENLDMSKSTSTAWMFTNCKSLTELNVKDWDISNVTNMFNMFGGCEKLVKLDVSKWNTSNVTIMTSVFDYCQSINEINVDNWNVSNVTSVEFMFYKCEKLVSLDLHKWDTSNITNMFEMFGRCYSIESINLKGWDTSNVTNMSGMFVCDFNLETLDLSSFDMSKVKFGKYDDDMIHRCPSLRWVKTPRNLKKKIPLNSGLTYVKKTGNKLGKKEYKYIPKSKKSITLVCAQEKGKRTSIKNVKSSGSKVKVNIKPVETDKWYAPVQYEIQCSTNRNFTDSVGIVTNTTENTYNVQGNVIDSTTAIIKGLKKGNTYYVRVRVCEYEKRVSDWSKVKKIKVGK